MDKVTKSGRTILFVSHNLGAVRSLCNKAVLMHGGKLIMQGRTSDIVDHYLDSTITRQQTSAQKRVSSCGRILMEPPSWLNAKGEFVERYHYGENPCLQFELEFKENMKGVVVGIGLNTRDGNRIFTSHSVDDSSFTQTEFIKGKYTIRTQMDMPSLAPGHYDLVYGIKDNSGATLLYAENDIQLEIESTRKIKDGDQGLFWHTGSWMLAGKP